MELDPWIKAFDAAINNGMAWLTDHGGLVFDIIRAALEGTYDALTEGLLLLPFWVVALALGALAARRIGWKAGLAAALGIALCWAIGLWSETVETMCLVIVSVLLAVLVGVPVGIWSGYSTRVTAVLDPV